MTQVSSNVAGGSVSRLSSGNALPAAAVVDLPAGGSTRAPATFESVEGMVVEFTDTLVVSEYFELARFGQLTLTAEERPYQFTHANLPSVDGYAAFLDGPGNPPDHPRRRQQQPERRRHRAGRDEPYPCPQGGSRWTTGSAAATRSRPSPVCCTLVRR